MHHDIWIFWKRNEFNYKIFKLTLYKLGLIPSSLGSFFFWLKNPIKINGQHHHAKDKREGQRKAKRCVTCKNQKMEKTLVPCMVGSYFTHNPFNVACMQIVRSNSNRRLKTNISCQPIFLSIAKAKHAEKQY